MKKFKFNITETWAVEHTVEANDLEEAYDIATEWQNELDMDLSKANYIEGFVALVKEESDEF